MSDPRNERRARKHTDVAALDEIFGSEQADQRFKSYDSTLFRRLMAYVTPYRKQLLAALALMALSNAATVAAPNIVGFAIDAVSAGVAEGGDVAAASRKLLLLLAALSAATIIEWLTNRGRLYILAEMGTRVIVDIRMALFEHLQSLSIRFYDTYKVGRLISRIMGDVAVLQDFVTWSIVGTARSLFTLAFIIVTLLLRDAKLAVLVMLVLPVMAGLTRMWSARARDAWREVRRRIAIINGYLNETVTGVRVIKSFARESVNERTFESLNRRHLEANLHAARLAAVFFPTVDALGTIAVAIVVLYAAFAPEDTFTAGDLTAFVLLVDRFFEPIRELSRRYNQLLATMAASERLFELLDMVPEVQDAEDAYDIP
ncbi:MAG: ABC transporter ATP-binding protein, partial [Anaerolineae bacterium]